MQLRWINHASFLISHGDVGLICDPWLFGDAFDRGWSLLSETKFTPDDFQDVTHIWFSHEHPDHFSPPSLKAIPAEVRGRITVIYQSTLDGRVASFCRGLGFNAVVELAEDETYDLSDAFSIRVYPYTFGDSWACLRVGDLTLVNLNDCVVNTRDKAKAVAARVGKVDVLFTQFSNAQGIGNPEDTARRRAAANEKLARIKAQVTELQPRFVVPFASFIWFSHIENQCHNDGANTVHMAVDFIDNETEAEAVCLYPDDEWDGVTTIDSQAALRRYQANYDALESRAPHTSPSIDLDTLRSRHSAFMERLVKKNGPIVLRGLAWTRHLRRATVHLTDLGCSLQFDLKRFETVDCDASTCDVSLSSSALDYCFHFDWGGDTLSVNGRFTTPPGGEHARFRRYFSLANLNNRGQTVFYYLPVLRDRALAQLKGMPRSVMSRLGVGKSEGAR
jgi:UDP-MurNAc hydroxylase